MTETGRRMNECDPGNNEHAGFVIGRSVKVDVSDGRLIIEPVD
jgi:hypothetical protein